MSGLIEIEIQIITWVQNLGGWLTPPMRALTFMGTEYFYLPVILALYWSIDALSGFRAGMLLFLSAGLNDVFKMFLRTPRPFWIDPKVKALNSEISFGAPSGHSQNSAAVWGAVAASVRKKWVSIVAIVVVFLIGLSRIYLGVHFPHDVLSGWIIGLLILSIYLKLEKPFGNWLGKRSLGIQLVVCAIFSTLFIALGVTAKNVALNWVITPSWVSNALLAGGVQPDPFNFDSLIMIAGASFGFTAGFAWWRAKHGEYQINCTPGKRFLRYFVGMAGVVVLYLGLKYIFPEQPPLLYLFFRYTRYTLIGVWVSALAPLVFKQLRLDR